MIQGVEPRMKLLTSAKTNNRNFQDSIQKQGEPKNYKTVSKNNLSDFAKEVIRECVEQPNTNVYSIYAEVFKYCDKSGYTIEQVGKYLRYVKRAIIRKNVLTAPLKKINKEKETVSTYVSKAKEDKWKKSSKNTQINPFPSPLLPRGEASFLDAVS